MLASLPFRSFIRVVSMVSLSLVTDSLSSEKVQNVNAPQEQICGELVWPSRRFSDFCI
jgi:hypothetical protein